MTLTISEILLLYGATTDEIIGRHLAAMVEDLRLMVILEQSRTVADAELERAIAAYLSERGA